MSLGVSNRVLICVLVILPMIGSACYLGPRDPYFVFQRDSERVELNGSDGSLGILYRDIQGADTIDVVVSKGVDVNFSPNPDAMLIDIFVLPKRDLNSFKFTPGSVKVFAGAHALVYGKSRRTHTKKACNFHFSVTGLGSLQQDSVPYNDTLDVVIDLSKVLSPVQRKWNLSIIRGKMKP